MVLSSQTVADELSLLEDACVQLRNAATSNDQKGFSEKLRDVRRCVDNLQSAVGLPKFTFYWRDGIRDVFEGVSVSDAFSRAGYGAGALGALDFHAEGENDDYYYESQTRTWRPKKSPLCQQNEETEK